MGSLAGEAVLVNYVLLARFTDWAAGIPQIGGEARQIRLGEAILCVDSIRILSDWLGGGRVLAVWAGALPRPPTSVFPTRQSFVPNAGKPGVGRA